MKIILVTMVLGTAMVLSACAGVGQPVQHSACQADKAASLVGTRGLNDQQIQEVTGAKMVRRMLPNQSMSKDYRANRVNIIIDVPTKQIIKASCG